MFKNVTTWGSPACGCPSCSGRRGVTGTRLVVSWPFPVSQGLHVYTGCPLNKNIHISVSAPFRNFNSPWIICQQKKCS